MFMLKRKPVAMPSHREIHRQVVLSQALTIRKWALRWQEVCEQ